MYAQIEKSKENKSRAVANSVSQKKSEKASFGFVDNRQPFEFSDNRNEVKQMMSIRNGDVNSQLDNATALHHVGANEAARLTMSESRYYHNTMVDNANEITGIVDADNGNFNEANGFASNRLAVQGNATVHEYEKAILGAGMPVEKTETAVVKNCQVTVRKTGDDRLVISHFAPV